MASRLSGVPSPQKAPLTQLCVMGACKTIARDLRSHQDQKHDSKGLAMFLHRTITASQAQMLTAGVGLRSETGSLQS